MTSQVFNSAAAVLIAIGRAVSWLLLFLTVLCFANVVMRSGWSVGWVALQELVLQAHAVALLLAAPWVLLVDEHVRVDIVYRRQSAHRRAWIDRLGVLLLLLPTCLLFIWASTDYVWASVKMLEGSPEAGGLPGLFVIKALIPLVFVLLAVAGLLTALRTNGAPERIDEQADSAEHVL